MTTPLTPDDVQANLEVVKLQVPTLEEQMFSTCMALWNGDQYVNYDFIASIFVAPIRLKILSMALVWDYFNQSASDSNYWRIRLRSGDNSAPYKYIAARSTESTGAETNGPIAARVAWTFDAAAWGDASLEPGDLLQLHCTQGGNPSDMRFPCTATVRYAAL
jgi:hypothetical protein